jgi:hypothetical protein
MLPIEGITASLTQTGDIKIVLHLEDLERSLATAPTLNNHTHVLVALRRYLPSAKGHTHQKPVSVVHATNGKKA